MKNKLFIIIIIIIVIFVIGIVGSAVVFMMPSKSHVRILSDGKEVYTADLKLTEDTVFDVAYQGHVNTVEIKDHKIHVKDADCPDQTCVKEGKAKPGKPLVCLPNHVIVTVTASDGEPDYDAISK